MMKRRAPPPSSGIGDVITPARRLDLAHDVSRTPGSSSDSASSRSSRAPSLLFRHRQHFGQPQREREQPLLSPRAECARIHAVQLDGEVIACGPASVGLGAAPARAAARAQPQGPLVVVSPSALR